MRSLHHARAPFWAIAFVTIATGAFADPQQEQWTQELFGNAAWPATGTHRFVEWDDGSGHALYSTGVFEVPGSAGLTDLARWSGSRWIPIPGVDIFAVGPVANAHPVAFDSGPLLGIWIGKAVANSVGLYLEHWDGQTLQQLDSDDGPNREVKAMVAFDDGLGDGEVLFIGGNFTEIAGVPMRYFARWDGEDWSEPAPSNSARIQHMVVFDGAIYAVMYYNFVMRFNGEDWEVVGDPFNESIEALMVGDDGAGPTLYVGGKFTQSGGANINHIAKLQDDAWVQVGDGFDDQVSYLASCDNRVYANGYFLWSGDTPVERSAVWDGTQWEEFDVDRRIMYVFEHGGENLLFVNGGSRDMRYQSAVSIWDGAAWSVTGSGQGVDNFVYDLAQWDDGSGPALYACGDFQWAGSESGFSGMGTWEGERWHHVHESEVTGAFSGSLRKLLPFDAGNGESLYVLGEFDEIDGSPASNIARLAGNRLVPVHPATDGGISDALVWDDGNGEAMFIAGEFTTAGGEPASCIARWDGEQFTRLGTGDFDDAILDIAVYDDGSGEALYAAGEFRIAGGVSANYIARWDGASWSPVGNDIDNPVAALAVFDDGSGPVLVAAGAFNYADGEPVWDIAQWNGNSWSDLDGGTGSYGYYITELAVDHEHPDGPYLYAAGYFSEIGGVEAERIARWDGSSWQPMLTNGRGLNGLNGDEHPLPHAFAMLPCDDAGGRALYVGGRFKFVGDFQSTYIARWGPALPPSIVPAILRSVEVLQGEHLRGNKAKLRESDDRYYKTQSTFEGGGGDPNILKLRLIFRTDVTSPRRLNIDVESRINESGASERVYLLNVVTGNYDLIEARPLGHNESVFKLRNIDAEEYVDPSGKIRILVKHTLTAGLSSDGFKSFVDRLTLDVKR